MIILGFWSWARGLEDVFDATHRSRLSDLFSQVEEDQNDDEKAYNDQTGEGNGSASTSVNDKGDNNQMRKRGSTPGPPAYDRALQLVGSDIVSPRLPVFAIFHNAGGNTSSGVPHSFSAFLKCWPSIPTVMVSRVSSLLFADIRALVLIMSFFHRYSYPYWWSVMRMSTKRIVISLLVLHHLKGYISSSYGSAIGIRRI